MIKKRTAFTMLELIFVIVVMGILGKYGVEFLARAYDNFIFTKINDDLQAKSASSVEFIVKRLENRIKKSASSTRDGANRQYLMGGLTDDSATVLEWIAVDDDSFRGTTIPLWTGVIDLAGSNAGALLSPGSTFNDVSTNISVLSDGGATLSNGALFFIDSKLTQNPWGFNGAINDQSQTLHPIQATANTTLASSNGSSFSGVEVSEYYKLTWTANAVRLVPGANNMGKLYFYYDYRPWAGETYADGKNFLLAEGISTFRFRSAGAMVKVQVCAKSDLTEEYALCKEKTVF